MVYKSDLNKGRPALFQNPNTCDLEAPEFNYLAGLQFAVTKLPGVELPKLGSGVLFLELQNQRKQHRQGQQAAEQQLGSLKLWCKQGLE